MLVGSQLALSNQVQQHITNLVATYIPSFLGLYGGGGGGGKMLNMMCDAGAYFKNLDVFGYTSISSYVKPYVEEHTSVAAATHQVSSIIAG